MAMSELHSVLGRLQAEGAMDEEGPFIQHLMEQVQRGKLAPQEALQKLQQKMQSRGDYH